jgi:Protein of unknown function (DUF1269)
VGLLFLNPLAGFAVGGLVGAGSGALSGSLVDYGIDDNFIRSLAETLQPDTSALFVLVRKAQQEKYLPSSRVFVGRSCGHHFRLSRRPACRPPSPKSRRPKLQHSSNALPRN